MLCLTKIVYITHANWDQNIKLATTAQTLATNKINTFWTNLDNQVATIKAINVVPIMASNFAPTNYLKLRGLFTDTTQTLDKYKAFLTDKLTKPNYYGLHPFLVNSNIVGDVTFYLLKRADSSRADAYMTDTVDIIPTINNGIRVNNFLVLNMACLIEKAMETGDVNYISKWCDYMYKWLCFTPLSNWDDIQDLEQGQILDIIYLYRYFGTLANFYTNLWQAIPTDLIVRIILKHITFQLPLYIRYFQNNAQNWSTDIAPVLLSHAYLLDEWNVGPFCFNVAINAIQHYITNIVLPDGCQTQPDPWYNYMYYNFINVIYLIKQRRFADFNLCAYETSIYNTAIIEQTLQNITDKISNFLISIVQYNKQFPACARTDARNTMNSIYYGGYCAGIANLSPSLLNKPIPDNVSSSFVYGGFHFSKTDHSYVFLYNSPKPPAGSGYRGKYNNNTVTFSCNNQDILVTNEIGNYDYIQTPVSIMNLFMNKIFI